MIKNSNKKRSKFLQKQAPLLVILVVAVCVYIAHSYQSSSHHSIASGLKSTCTFSNNICELSIDDELAVARFSETPIPEESITLSVRLPEGKAIESAWIEGVNMYMGKIPVLFDETDGGEWQGWFMLGSCSEPVMTWQLRINIKKQAAPSYLYFTTES